MEAHTDYLRSLCRICSNKLGRVSYDCRAPPATHKEGTPIVLLINEITSVVRDDPRIHPPRFCHSCYNAMKRMRASKESGKAHRTSLRLHAWSEHREGGCTTCDMVEERKRGGRPKKKLNSIGRPGHLATHIRSVISPQYRCV